MEGKNRDRITHRQEDLRQKAGLTSLNYSTVSVVMPAQAKKTHWKTVSAAPEVLAHCFIVLSCHMAELLQFINNSIIRNQSSERESEKKSNYASVCLKDCSYSIKFQNLWRQHFKASFGSINLIVLPAKRSFNHILAKFCGSIIYTDCM